MYIGVVGSRGRFGRWIAGVVICFGPAVTFAEDDRNYYLPDGRSVGLTRSATELSVTLKAGQDFKSVAERFERSGQGSLRAFPNSARARTRLLHVSKADGAQRSKLRLDPAVEDVRPVYRFATSPVPVASSGEVVVKVRPQVSENERQRLWDDFGIALAVPEDGLPNVYRLGPYDADFDEVDLAARLAGDPRTLWAQPNFRRPYEARQIDPTDAFFDSQWHHRNTGQTGGESDADIDTPDAWLLGEGQDIVFSMFDDSCDVDHEDLRDNYIGTGHDPTLPSNNSGFSDPRPKQLGDTHGTRVMGLAVARANNVGGLGVSHLSRFTASRGLGDLITDAQIASAFTFARQQEVDVHVNSWGAAFAQPNPQIIVDAIELAFSEGRNLGDLDGDGTDDPLGMVIVFAAGNFSVQNVPGFELSTVPQVIAVGASDDADGRAGFSNFGTTLDVMAPGAGITPDEGIFTTDNTDGTLVSDGANQGGFNVEDERPDIAGGRYTKLFGGTSAACPIVAGVAGIILSVNPLLSATDVRVVIEHTADPISPDEADYHPITSRSLRYGYGRVNANGAAIAAQQSLSNGGRTWPDRPANVTVANNSIRWKQSVGTDEFLVLESSSGFDFIPEDGRCYDGAQIGCGSAALAPLPSGVSVIATGCNLVCSSGDTAGCEPNANQCVSFLSPGGTKSFAIFGRSTTGRYSWGVAADSTGAVVDSGELAGGSSGGGGGGGGGGGLPDQGPAVTISVSPLRGKSPLTVNFAGNAVSALPIDENKTAWDFDIDDDQPVDVRSRNATHTYTAAEGTTRTFVARFTMFDTEGNSGSQTVTITVEGQTTDSEPPEEGEFRIIVGLPGTPGSNVDSGQAPFQVLLSVDASNLSGTLQSVSWDLGDGSRATTLVVPHTYLNDNEEALRIPITATVTSITSGGSILTTSATRIITVLPGSAAPPTGPPTLPGTGASGPGGRATPCGPMGMIPLFFVFLALTLWRRHSN